MACANHPEVITGLDTCTACGKTFCIDCLVGRKSGWFCSACDPESKQRPAAPAMPPAATPPFGRVGPARPKAAACANHPEVLEGLSPCARCDHSFCPDCLIELQGTRLCAASKNSALKDLQSGVDASGLQLAGILHRFAAQLIDSVITTGIMMIFMFLLGAVVAVSKPDPESVVVPLVGCGVYVVIFGVIFAYHGLMLQHKGQTLGKMAMKIKVVTVDGGPISPGQAWIRVLVWFLLQNCMITYIPAFFNPDKATIHDMAARTRVVKIG